MWKPVLCGYYYIKLLRIVVFFEQVDQGRARTQSPTTRNYAVEIPTFGEFAKVSTAESAMAEPRLGWTTFLIMVSPLPGKYELYTSLRGESLTHILRTLMVLTVYKLTKPEATEAGMMLQDLNTEETDLWTDTDY